MYVLLTTGVGCLISDRIRLYFKIKYSYMVYMQVCQESTRYWLLCF